MVQIKRSWVIIAGIVLLVLVGFFAVGHLLDADTYRGRIEKALSDSLGRPVQLGHLDFSLFSGSLLAESPAIADDPAFSNQPFLTAKSVHIGVEVLPLLLHRQVHINGFTIDQPKIILIRAENGTWNYSSIGSEGKRKAPTAETNDLIPNLTVGKVDIKDGSVTMGTLPQQGQPHIYSDLNISVQNFSFARAFPFTVSGKLPEGGSIAITGNAGPINQHDASLTPLTAQIGLKHADLVSAGLVQPSQGISGIADLDTKVTSNGQTAQADGKLHLAQLKLAKNGTPSSQPVDLQFNVNQDLQSLSGKINSATMQIGKAALALAGTYTTRGNTTTTQINVDGKNMPIDDLVAFLPSLGTQLPSGSRLQGGTLTLSLEVAGPTTAPVISGPVHIANTQLAGFDLGQKLASIQAFTGAKTGSNTTIQALSTNLRYSTEGVQTNNLAAIVAGLGSASGNGSISANNALNYRLLIKLDSTGIGGLATQAASLLPGVFGSAVSQATANGIPVTIGGTTANPTFTPDMSKLVRGNTQQQQQNLQSNPLGKALSGLFHK
ncbi:MAG: AsmA family protein [Acidobacteriaceae bacterium]|nr:AsmA family protein [Acidobacteriaceae bacterium]